MSFQLACPASQSEARDWNPSRSAGNQKKDSGQARMTGLGQRMSLLMTLLVCIHLGDLIHYYVILM